VRKIHAEKGNNFCGFFEINRQELTAVFGRGVRPQTPLPTILAQILPRGPVTDTDLRVKNPRVRGYFALGPNEQLISGQTVAL
jgi:hypothetical protein